MAKGFSLTYNSEGSINFDTYRYTAGPGGFDSETLDGARGYDVKINLTQGDPDQGNPLKKHVESSITFDQWIAKYQGKSYTDIITEAGWKQGLPLGPSSRYVINPNDGNIMDMRHVMVVGFLGGTTGGDAVENIQNALGQTGSAYDPQDYYSNQIGASFASYVFWKSFQNDWVTTFYQFMTQPNK